MDNKKLVLMYHSIVKNEADLPPQREVGADLYDVKVTVFEEHIRVIKSMGKKVARVEEAGESDLVITFDDGEMNNFQYALPLLKANDFPAYFFIITKRVGRPGYMGHEQLKEMIRQGMIIGSHGMSHEILTNLKDTQIEEELSASKKYLERNLDIPIHDLSIPRGFCNDKIINMALEAGYKNVFISERPSELKTDHCYSRVAVKKSWSGNRFEQALNNQVPLSENMTDKVKNSAKKLLPESGYNWLRNTYIKLFK